MNGTLRSPRRLLLAGAAAFAFLGIVTLSGVAAPDASTAAPAADGAAASRGFSDPDMNGGPGPSSAVVAQESVRPGPDLSGVPASGAARPSEDIVPPASSPELERHAILVAARIQEKYRPFRDSLRAP